MLFDAWKIPEPKAVDKKPAGAFVGFKRFVMNTIQRILVPLCTFLWWEYLEYDIHGHPQRNHIVKVKGWRTFLVDGFGGRSTITPLFKIWKWYL